MSGRGRVFLAALIAAGMMLVAVGSATARRLSINERQFKIIWRNLEVVNEEVEIDDRCPITLEGSFHSFTIHKVPRALIGYLTRGAVQPAACTGGTATILFETMPWHITYEGFTGTLPNITGFFILLRNFSYRVQEMSPLGTITCLITLANLLFFIPGTTEPVNGFKPAEVNPESETFECRGGIVNVREHLRGNGRVSRQGSTENILIRLI